MLLSTNKNSNLHHKHSILDTDMNQIARNIFIGDEKSAKNYLYLKEIGIKHIVVAGEELTLPFPQTFNYLHIKVKDSHKEKISAHFQDVCHFIQNAINKKQNVLVHCAYGVSRSSTLVIAFLMKKLKISYYEAFTFVRRKRPIIKPNLGFEEQLKIWETSLSTVSK